MYFVIIPGELVPIPRKVVFELKKLIVPDVYSMCFSFVPGDLVLAPRENSFGFGDLTYNLGENCPLCLFLHVHIPLAERLN